VVTQRGAPQPFFIVRVSNPMPFSKYAEQKHLSKELLTPAKWEEMFDNRRSGLIFGDETLKRLEKGESVSRWEAEYEAMYDGGQLDGDGNIIYANFFPGQVEIPEAKLKYGMLVEVTEKNEKAGLPGRFWGKLDDGKVGLLELFSPMPYMETPDTVASPFIKPDFISKFTYALGYGTYQTWELMRGRDKLPKGHFAEGSERVYYLDEAIPLAKVEKSLGLRARAARPGAARPLRLAGGHHEHPAALHDGNHVPPAARERRHRRDGGQLRRGIGPGMAYKRDSEELRQALQPFRRRLPHELRSIDIVRQGGMGPSWSTPLTTRVVRFSLIS
jgi:hypothetical protein